MCIWMCCGLLLWKFIVLWLVISVVLLLVICVFSSWFISVMLW